MRILVINIPTGKEDGPYGDYMRNVYAPALKRGFDAAIQRDDVEYTFRTCEWGLEALDVPIYEYVDTLTRRQVFHAGVNAEAEGFDGVLVDCFGDPMMDQLRQALDIPVIGLGEAAVTSAVSMGRKYSVIQASPNQIRSTELELFAYGQLENLVSMPCLPPGGDMLMGNALVESGDFLDMFIESAREGVNAGAEVILPGCCLISIAAMQAPGARDKFPDGVKEVDGAAVLDLLGSAILTLEKMIKTKASGSPFISRKLTYKFPKPHEKAAFENVTQDPSLKFWDVVL